jgi:hypothetical protein
MDDLSLTEIKFTPVIYAVFEPAKIRTREKLNAAADSMNGIKALSLNLFGFREASLVFDWAILVEFRIPFRRLFSLTI